MKTKALIGWGFAGCLALAAALSTAQDAPDHKLSDFELGEHISGEETDLKRLDGKVVAIEYWGTR